MIKVSQVIQEEIMKSSRIEEIDNEETLIKITTEVEKSKEFIEEAEKAILDYLLNNNLTQFFTLNRRALLNLVRR